MVGESPSTSHIAASTGRATARAWATQSRASTSARDQMPAAPAPAPAQASLLPPLLSRQLASQLPPIAAWSPRWGALWRSGSFSGHVDQAAPPYLARAWGTETKGTSFETRTVEEEEEGRAYLPPRASVSYGRGAPRCSRDFAMDRPLAATVARLLAVSSPGRICLGGTPV